ncbi:VanZ family protein [Paenibacillus sp. NFR01]|uniref:VanZ family protein n=1 Tax=Paenibacillus sp. NFR01 TaxID=1566279 RepID=UPI0008C6F752|nr:VanZ family protein [Paenibacillus sp. NFR01]SEU09198.1 Glycopeptide antibiotics resistance protein [Paenibacillus sp. NFR01]
MEQSIMFTIHSTYILASLFLFVLLFLVADALWKKRKRNVGQYFIIITFSIYLLCVIQLVFFPIEVNIGKYANLTPWYKTINFIPLLTIDIITFILNIIMLIPLGVYLPLLHKKFESLKNVAYSGFFLSLSIEVLQMMIRIICGNGRSTDINDLIANTVGAVLGYIVINGLLKRSNGNHIWSKLRLG